MLRIAQVGAQVQGLAAGQLVFSLGHHRSWQRADYGEVVPLPAGLAAVDALFCRLMAVSMTTLVTTSARPPRPVLVTGLGPVGLLAAQIFQSAGYAVVAVEPHAGRCAVARSMGLGDVRQAIDEQDPTLRDQIALHLECSGHEGAVLSGLRVVRRGGEVVLIGCPWRRRSDQVAFEIVHSIFHRYVTLRSGWEWELPRHETPFAPGTIDENITAAMRWLKDGRIQVRGLYQEARPQDAQAIYQGLLHQTLPHPVAVFRWE